MFIFDLVIGHTGESDEVKNKHFARPQTRHRLCPTKMAVTGPDRLVPKEICAFVQL